MREALFIAAFGVLSAGSLGAAPRYDAADPPARMEHPGPDQWSVCIGTASERDSDAGVPPSEGATEALRQLAAGCHMYGHGRAGYSLDA